jgi:hypothetical protein
VRPPVWSSCNQILPVYIGAWGEVGGGRDVDGWVGGEGRGRHSLSDPQIQAAILEAENNQELDTPGPTGILP